MTAVTVRPMTPEEYAQWQTLLAEEYSAEQVAAGRWSQEGSVQRARDETAKLLPQGLATEGMLILRGVDAEGVPVGRAWVSLDHPRGAPGVAFLYDIEVVETKRGQGFGRALLAAVEDATRRAGAAALELNVFGSNAVAIGLYGSAGYDVVTQQMRKAL
ncbi:MULTISPECIES: GNAT family N-acetyltransferase [unclassified Microbacterium]|uniref:GNAT family N-acetyltransferase n=1 Tax=unclassified Microbacterium TaxID=2609290 RepID=UPI00214C8D83|nr:MULTISPECIES: GNAT family N-acetyltransferase [unclassified Microbacterium]MCR2785727.1 GNAT family N-acetyltransferase [Microbacterium sp. zg.B96]WIM17289.1 GNAT family N-acetyltransferase [Microbacterium sp. zg-B96]